MSLLDYQGAIAFYVVVVFLIYLNRKKLDQEAPFVYLYRTKLGIAWMEKVSSRFRKIVKALGYIGVGFAYLGFVFVSYALIRNAYDLIIQKPDTVGGGLVVPGLPVGGLGVTLPLITGWISLFIIMIVHEFSHGLVSKAHGVKVNHSGIAFFGPMLGAFVEPDEKDLVKQPPKVQLSIFAAGPFSNFVLWGVCIGLMLLIAPVFNNLSVSHGVQIGVMTNESLPAEAAGIPQDAVITGVDGTAITTMQSLSDALDKLEPGQEVTITTQEGSYQVITTNHPDNSSDAYLGIWLLGEDRTPKDNTPIGKAKYFGVSWLFELLDWTQLISLAIGLMNLFPIFITDGARMLRTNVETWFKDKEKGLLIWKNINIAATIIVIIILFLPPIYRIMDLIAGLL